MVPIWASVQKPAKQYSNQGSAKRVSESLTHFATNTKKYPVHKMSVSDETFHRGTYTES